MSTNTDTTGSKNLRPNQVLIAKRKERGWASRGKAARELRRIGLQHRLPVPDLDALEKAMYRHETGRSVVRDPLYSDLYCLAYEATPHELFGEVETTAGPTGDKLRIKSHKFIPAYIGCQTVADLVASGRAGQAEGQWMPCHQLPVDHPDGTCELYLWPFGIAVFHLIEDLELPNIASLAVWRPASYEKNRRWASDQLSRLTGQNACHPSYALSLYWVHEPIWAGEELATALRVLSMPRVLLERDNESSEDPLAHAELVERALLQDGFDHPEMVPFGIKGISLGYASWSGVVYYPQAPRRALSEEELIPCELAAQAIWAYCEHISQQVERGEDPQVPGDYGWRFLRGVRSRLTNARPRESEQHRSMRHAVLETSGLVGHLAQAVEILRETSGE